MRSGGGAAGVVTGVFSQRSGFNTFARSHDTFMNMYERNLLQPRRSISSGGRKPPCPGASWASRQTRATSATWPLRASGELWDLASTSVSKQHRLKKRFSTRRKKEKGGFVSHTHTHSLLPTVQTATSSRLIVDRKLCLCE